MTTSAAGSARATQCGAWCARRPPPPPGAGRTPHRLPRRPVVAYRSCPAGPAARCSRDTPSRTAAATAPEARRRVPRLHDSCLPDRCTRETRSATLSFSSGCAAACSARPALHPHRLRLPPPQQARLPSCQHPDTSSSERHLRHRRKPTQLSFLPICLDETPYCFTKVLSVPLIAPLKQRAQLIPV